MIDAVKNPAPDDIQRILALSPTRTARRLVDEITGDVWVWPAEQATHADAARQLGATYSRPPGAGEIIVG